VNVRKLRPECVIVFTDGYVEPEVKWDINVPTLWLVTRNKGWTPPTGRKVVFGD
jgi:predicted metal-dependent peptidase